MVNSTQTKQSNTRSLQNTYNIYEKCMSGHQNFLYQNVPAFRFPHSLKKKHKWYLKKDLGKKIKQEKSRIVALVSAPWWFMLKQLNGLQKGGGCSKAKWSSTFLAKCEDAWGQVEKHQDVKSYQQSFRPKEHSLLDL